VSIDKGEGAEDVDDLSEIEEKQKLIIDVKLKESAVKVVAEKKIIPAKTSMMSSL
jgi:hypothetical protein